MTHPQKKCIYVINFLTYLQIAQRHGHIDRYVSTPLVYRLT